MIFPSIIESGIIFFTLFVIFLILLSAIKISVGVRRAYVNFLLRIFEYGRVSIETAHKERHGTTSLGDKSNTEKITDVKEPYKCSVTKANLNRNEASNENTNGNTLINRDNVLLPTVNEGNLNAEGDAIRDVSFIFHLVIIPIK